MTYMSSFERTTQQGDKKSGQPKVKAKHLSHRAVGEVRAAISQGHRLKALEK